MRYGAVIACCNLLLAYQLLYTAKMQQSDKFVIESQSKYLYNKQGVKRFACNIACTHCYCCWQMLFMTGGIKLESRRVHACEQLHALMDGRLCI